MSSTPSPSLGVFAVANNREQSTVASPPAMSPAHCPDLGPKALQAEGWLSTEDPRHSWGMELFLPESLQQDFLVVQVWTPQGSLLDGIQYSLLSIQL